MSADAGEQGDIIAKLSIDLNNDGYNENIEILRTSDIDMSVRLIRGTKNGQITDLSEELPFEHLAGLTVYPIMGATYPHAVVIQGTAGAHRSFLNVYYIGEDGRFSKLFECSGDGGASLFGPLAGGGYGIMVCSRLYDTLNRDETKYYHWDGSEFVLVRREIGYHFTGKFVYPRDPETVAAAYVEAAVLI
ncbi:MAG: hypothetical protein HPY71_11250 [Firmicutes bacterium]|nr:hypothetical protein [Bacillota bacterium]